MLQRSVVTALSRTVKGTAQVGPEQTPSFLILLAQGLEVRKLLLVFGHKPAALVRQQSWGFLETKQLPGPQVTMHPRYGGIWVARKHPLGGCLLQGCWIWDSQGLLENTRNPSPPKDFADVSCDRFGGCQSDVASSIQLHQRCQNNDRCLVSFSFCLWGSLFSISLAFEASRSCSWGPIGQLLCRWTEFLVIGFFLSHSAGEA